MTSCEFMHKLYLKSTDIGRSVAPWLQTVESIFVHFCRAMLYKRGLCRHAVSVCLSVTFVNSVKTTKYIFNFFHRPVATPFYFFHTKRHGDILTMTSITGASNTGERSQR